ncbi:glycoside hydrolase family 43 protein [Actinoplanes sp. NPDC023801]|uniref:glycoside hydrolase family 43 protein n=1 Tax=Actinoplanes sp. NPDC023801 TaxID=3154595 RepID=UPI0033E4AC4F
MRPLILLVPLLALTACTGTTAGPSPSQGATMAATFTNPVYAENFPDPGVIHAGGTWYAYGTNNATQNVPLLTSPDLVRWTAGGDVLPQLGRWAVEGHTWAPEVVRTATGRYVLYYTARWAGGDRQCIGAAVADAPDGPFTDASPEPLICQDDEGGSIDASPYLHTDGQLYLYWKNDGNHIGRPTHLYGQRLTPDGLALTGERVRLLTNDKPWQAHVIEAPQMVRHDDRLFLFYSANAFDTDAYAVGYATCATPLGPCTDAAENPILKSSAGAAGPGHSYLVTGADGTTWLLYHAWSPDAIGSTVPGRQLWLDRVDWVDDGPVVRGPTTAAQPLPG